MPEIILTLDASEYMAAFNAGLEAGFMLANETPALDEQLNVNGIGEVGDE